MAPRWLLFVQQIFSGHLLSLKCYSLHCGYSSKRNRPNTCPYDVYIIRRWWEVKIEKYIMLWYMCMGKKMDQVSKFGSIFLVKPKLLSMVYKRLQYIIWPSSTEYHSKTTLSVLSYRSSFCLVSPCELTAIQPSRQ